MNSPVFFFTAEDPREIPKGSRDPLRFLPVWTQVARGMIPNLTTVTPSYRGFLTRFLFHGMLEDLAPELAHASIDEQWLAFCKFEQLCALVRVGLSPETPNFPGISGVSNRQHNGVVRIGSDSGFWLVRSQKNTGYWGYYHQASLGSQLLQANAATRPGYRLSDEALEQYRNSKAVQQLIKNYSPTLEQLLEKDVLELELEEFTTLAELFAAKPLQLDSDWGSYWLERLMIPSGTRFKAFAEAVKRIVDAEPNSSAGRIWEALADSNQDDAVRAFANQVVATEAIIGLCEWVFDVCRCRACAESSELSVRAEWASQHGYDQNWLQRLRSIEAPHSAELCRFRHIALMSDNDSFEMLARELLNRHRSVMLTRKGPAWVELLDNDCLNIRDASDPGTPNFDTLAVAYAGATTTFFLHGWR